MAQIRQGLATCVVSEQITGASGETIITSLVWSAATETVTPKLEVAIRWLFTGGEGEQKATTAVEHTEFLLADVAT